MLQGALTNSACKVENTEGHACEYLLFAEYILSNSVYRERRHRASVTGLCCDARNRYLISSSIDSKVKVSVVVLYSLYFVPN